MESKKINQLATEMSPASSDLTIIGDPITGVSKKVTLEQISSLFASSISFYTNYASFPATGSVDTLYCAKDTNKLYIWSGSAYVETFPSQALLDTYQLRSEKGNANGYASLDGSGKVPSTQLPSYVDDVIEVANYASLPVTGETGKIYITLDNNKIYRWSGSVYVEIASNNAIWGSITGTLSNQTDLQNALNAKVPYTGATANVNLGEYELKTGQLTLDTTPTGTATVGTTRWNDTIGSSETTLKGGNVILKNGVDLVARVVNKVSPNTTLTKAAYPAVRVSGAQGQRLAVAYAQANNDNNSADTIGLVTETIATNQEGFIITVGQLEGINTTGSLQGETWADGDVLYLSPTTAGALTNIKPTGATGHIVVIGYVEYAHANNGKIYVKVMNGWELDELHNVYISSVANNQGLFYESSSDLWKNKSIATVLGYTPISLTSLSATSPLSYNNTTGAFSISQASGSTNGFLSSTDWTTFNNKQNALTNPITGTGASGRIAYFNGTTTQTGSAFLTWDNTDGILSTNSIYNFNNTTNAYMLSSNGENIGSIFNVASAKWSLGYGTSTTALGTPALTWDTSGRVGIGTTSPTTRLHVAGDIQSTTGVFLANTGGYFMTLNTLNGMYIDAANYLTLNTNGLERARITSTGNVGIGTSSPTSKLHIIGDSNTFTIASNNATTLYTTYRYNTTTDVGYIGNGVGAITGGAASDFGIAAAAGNLLFATGGVAERMRITSGGNVGIGTTAPTSPLHVGTATSGNQKIQHWGEPGFVNDYGLILRGSSLDGVFKFYGLNNGTETTAPILSMNRSSGNVGIGTTSPSYKLDVQNSGDFDMRLRDTTLGGTVGLLFEAANDFSGTSQAYIKGVLAGNSGLSDLIFGTAGTSGATTATERMRITSAGDLQLDSAQLNVPKTFLFYANSDTGGSYGNIKWKNVQWDGFTRAEIVVEGDGALSNGRMIFKTGSSGGNATEKMRITSGGDVCINATTTSGSAKLYVNGGAAFGSVFVGSLGTGTVYSSSGTLTNTNPSDKRLKENITPITYGLNEILQLNPVSFDWKNDNNKNKQFGFIAQEVQEVMPEAVIDGEYLGLEKDAINTALVNAIKELEARLKTLENK